MLAGCGVSEGGTPPSAAARVNAEVISVQELEAARKRDAGGDTLERLIDQRLARQHALEQGLERSPQIAQALESARTEILARAYRQLVAEAQPRPTPAEIRSYYAEHPELFAQRRIYSLESLDARFGVHRSTLAAEQLPLELLSRLQAMKEGEVLAIDDGAGGVVVLRIVAARLAPLDEASAAPLIEKFLLARRSSEALGRGNEAPAREGAHRIPGGGQMRARAFRNHVFVRSCRRMRKTRKTGSRSTAWAAATRSASRCSRTRTSRSRPAWPRTAPSPIR